MIASPTSHRAPRSPRLASQRTARWGRRLTSICAVLALAAPWAGGVALLPMATPAQAQSVTRQSADYIVAVVNR